MNVRRGSRPILGYRFGFYRCHEERVLHANHAVKFDKLLIVNANAITAERIRSETSCIRKDKAEISFHDPIKGKLFPAPTPCVATTDSVGLLAHEIRMVHTNFIYNCM